MSSHDRGCGHDHGDGLSCEEIFAKLSEYLDGELDPSICATLEDHMGDCPPCERFLESLKNTIGHLRTEPEATMPDGLRDQLLEAYRDCKRDGSL